MSVTLQIQLALPSFGTPPCPPGTTQALLMGPAAAYCYTTDTHGTITDNNDKITVSDYPASIPVDSTRASGVQNARNCYPQFIEATVVLDNPNDKFAVSIAYGVTFAQSGGFPQTLATYQLSGILTTGGGSSPPTTAAASQFLTVDATRRPLAALADPVAGSGAVGLYSKDAGHSFLRSTLDGDTSCADISLLLDRHGCTFAAIYTKGKPGSAALFTAFGPVADSFVPSTPPAPLAGVSGLFPICCEHPTDRLFALMALVSGSSLMAAQSGDGGHTWAEAGLIAGGVDFSASGRAGLCFLGETAFCAYAAGSQISCTQSPDRGKSWTDAAPAGSGANGTYSGVSLLGWQGTLYLLAFLTPPKSTKAPIPQLFVSGHLGQAWTAAAGVLPTDLTLPSAIGVIPHSGQLRLDTRYHSNDDAAIWLPD